MSESTGGSRPGPSEAVEATGCRMYEQGFASTFTVLAVVLLMALGAQLPDGWAPGWLAQQRAPYHAIWPQGWSFFADAPQQHNVVAYRIGPDGVPLDAMFPHQSTTNRWGMGRSAYAQIVEARQLAAQVPAGAWTVCAVRTVAECLPQAAARTPVEVGNAFGDTTLCGYLVLAEEHWVPRDERRRVAEPRALDRAVAVDVRCAGTEAAR